MKTKKESIIAGKIDNEFKQKERIFKRKFCAFCKNKETELCEIRPTIDRMLRCVYFEKEEN